MKRILLIAVLSLTVNFIYARVDTLRYENGSVFIGDTQKSYGTLYTTTGDIYIGFVKDGLPDSICTHYTNNGSKKGDTYYGEFKNGLYCGKGRIDFGKGGVLICDFVEGKPSDFGIIYFKNRNPYPYGYVYHGEIMDGVPHGEGKQYNGYNMPYYEGRFKKGILVEGYRNRTRRGVSRGSYLSGRSWIRAVSPTSRMQAAREYSALQHELKTYRGEKLTKEQVDFSLSLK